jgi:serine/threonine protein kinase
VTLVATPPKPERTNSVVRRFIAAATAASSAPSMKPRNEDKSFNYGRALYLSAPIEVSFGDVNVHETLYEGLASSVFRVSVAGFAMAMKTIVVPYENPAQSQELIKAILLAESLGVNRNVVRHLGHDMRDPRTYRQFMTLYSATLMKLLNSTTQPLPTPTIVDIACQTARGLAYVHQHKILHRDVKCENILIGTERANENASPTDVYKLGDLLECCRETRSGAYRANVGTPGFMAPEVYSETESVRPYNQMCDVWSFGMVLYQLLTREFPPPEVSGTGVRPPLPDTVSLQTTRLFVGLYNSCTETDPSWRNSMHTAVTFLESLSAF